MDRVLVLNADYSPLNVTSLMKGFNLVNKGRAEILKESENPIVAGEHTYPRPLIIRLLKYVKYRVRNLRINRQRLYKRDNFECTYCGAKKNLTIDHVIPKSRGGKNTWSNLVTCCSSCNRYKDNRTPEEAKMTLRHKPYEPSIFSDVIHASIEGVWNSFKAEMNL